MTETLIRPAPVEVVSPIKASEAIRLGCLLAPVQAFGHSGSGKSACVVAALTRAAPDLGIPPTHRFSCPEDDCPDHGWLIHLNDDHRWSRERIADWLESLGL